MPRTSARPICDESIPGRIPEFEPAWCRRTLLALLVAMCVHVGALCASEGDTRERVDFRRAWLAAGSGDRATFEQLMPTLRDYLLYPYLRYEELRFNRHSADSDEMAAFLAAHENWAFTDGLRTAWLIALGDRARWDDLLGHAPGSADTEVRCYLAQARIERGQTGGLLDEARKLWAVGKSQPDACDPVFSWLSRQGGITPGLAWKRFGLAMEAREVRLAAYLMRFLSDGDRSWADRWQQQERGAYRRLDQAARWKDNERSREITAFGLQRLARSDADRAASVLAKLDGRLGWSAAVHGAILREIALWSAVDGAAATPARMQAVPPDFRDDKLLEWGVRFALTQGDWATVERTIAQMTTAVRDDARWRYWSGRALLEGGNSEAAAGQLQGLARETNYYAFLAADLMDLPYTICPEQPEVEASAIEALAGQPGFDRALELRRADIRNWARSEWGLAARRLDRQGLRTAAALAVREDWPEMAIFALGNSGDLRWYEWRFPVHFQSLVESSAQQRSLDPSWVLGLMRSESAMSPEAVSSAGAMGLMQVMPATAQRLAQRHALSYQGRNQLLEPEANVLFGTAYLRDLMDQYGNNQVLASGAYNAGPRAVDRWLKDRPGVDAAVWIDTLPYFETRDYIPRVLAFTAIYDWRLRRPVSRLSARMPAFDSAAAGGTMQLVETADVVCPVSG